MLVEKTMAICMATAIFISVVAFVAVLFRLDRPIAERLVPVGIALALITLLFLVIAYAVSGIALAAIVLAIHATGLALFAWARGKLIEAEAGEVHG